MASHSNNFIRLRLYFDYPPPAVVGCRMCWLLVDLNVCRVVADLESVIREKFEFSRGSILSLFIEDCYLPHTESIYVVRDNDSVRVKVGCLAQSNELSSPPDAASENSRKRRQTTEEPGPGENGVSVAWKKKKRKKNNEDRMPEGALLVSSDDQNKEVQEKHTKKKKKKEAKENGTPATPKPADSPKKIPATVNQPSKSTKKPPASKPKPQMTSSSDSSSSSDEDVVPKKTTKTPTCTPAASKALSNTKPAPRKPHPPLSSSSGTESSDKAASLKIQPKNKPLKTTTTNSKSNQAPSDVQSTNCDQKQAASEAEPPHNKAGELPDSDSEEEIQLVIRRPLQQPSFGLGVQPPGRGRGRGKARRGGGQGERVTGDGRGAVRGQGGSFESLYNGGTEPSYQTDSQTNMSVILQNEAESVPKKDYSSMPLLAAPPQVGQSIAFKLLELSENYTPEVSEYKEGKIVSFDPVTRQIELELLNTSQAPTEPGKFDLVYQNPDGSERVEYAVSRGSWVTERWESLLEPRLII
ncbi:coilin [Archocentrus centrarchus]|uniref:coilin n=1 Tax=Archocentrus centrarchus TaxID=63155 RepID=UPI0011EA0389|nr:coilin [Archocentrus centrarchus]